MMASYQHVEWSIRHRPAIARKNKRTNTNILLRLPNRVQISQILPRQDPVAVIQPKGYHLNHDLNP